MYKSVVKNMVGLDLDVCRHHSQKLLHVITVFTETVLFISNSYNVFTIYMFLFICS